MANERRLFRALTVLYSVGFVVAVHDDLEHPLDAPCDRARPGTAA